MESIFWPNHICCINSYLYNPNIVEVINSLTFKQEMRGEDAVVVMLFDDSNNKDLTPDLMHE
jgi:hypothetical protein